SIFIEAKSQINTPEDCIDAFRICDATQNYYFEVNGIGNIDDANGALGLYCLSQANIAQWENNSAWFIFTAQYTGEFGLLICPDITTEDWNWALFHNNPNCSDLANNTYWLRCDSGSPVSLVDGCIGMGFKNGFFWGANGLEAYVNITAGTTYILHAVCRNSFTGSPPSRATLSFQGAVVTTHSDVFNYPGCVMSTTDFETTTATVFPNPFNNSLQIESNITFKTMELYDVLGKQIFNQNFENQLNTSYLAQGIYLLRLITEDGEVVVKKVVKE
ncbi:T9SS type A sorting domain-containing protein, partial [Flavobacterium sp. LMO8]|uniref:T9SS type A sorting domain-containing protein n=1 Tax=Flavobacterium sp. LMO8 TaxID=2654244 RepID=UPI00129174DC